MQAIFRALLQAVWSVIGSWAMKLAGKEFVEWALLKCAQYLVESTETKKDDEWFKKIKKEVQEDE